MSASAGSAATFLTFQEGAQAVRELSVFTAHGPYVLIQVARCNAGPDCEATFAARTLDLQLPLIDSFTPAAGPFAALPLDPTGLLARTLPLPPGQATATSGATYPVAGALHLESNPVQTTPLLSAAGVDDVAVSLTTVYQAKDAAAAQTLTQPTATPPRNYLAHRQAHRYRAYPKAAASLSPELVAWYLATGGLPARAATPLRQLLANFKTHTNKSPPNTAS